MDTISKHMSTVNKNLSTIGNTSVVDMRNECKSFISIPQYIIEDPVAFFKRLTLIQCYILNKFLYLDSQLLPIYMRQDTIGRSAGASREYTNRFIKYLCEMGFLSKQYRHMTSCVYVVNEWFRDVQVRSKLKHLLSALGYFHLSLLVPQVTQVINKYLYNIESSRSQRVAYSARACARGDFFSNGAIMINEYVSELEVDGVALTTEDRIVLSRYPEEIVRYALGKLEQISQVKRVDKKVAYLVSICKKTTIEEVKRRSSGPNKTTNRAPNVHPQAERMFIRARKRGESNEYIQALANDPRPIDVVAEEEYRKHQDWTRSPEFARQYLQPEKIVAMQKILKAQPWLEELCPDYMLLMAIKHFRPTEEVAVSAPAHVVPQRETGQARLIDQQSAERPLSQVLHSLFMA